MSTDRRNPRAGVDPLDPYDAVLLVSYGGPYEPDDVLPFMRNATRGRGVPDERLIEVSGHYQRFGGASPINERVAELRAALGAALHEQGSTVPVVVGNRNWHPFIKEALHELGRTGARRVLALLTSAYASYSGCRQYRENLAGALEELRAEGDPGGAIVVDKVRPYFTTPGFLAAATDSACDALADLADELAPHGGLDALRLVFVTHAIPIDMEGGSGPLDAVGPSAGSAEDGGGPPASSYHAAATAPMCGRDVMRASYVAQHEIVCRQIAATLERRFARPVTWDLVFCSRSGPPQQPWTDPDVNDHLTALARQGVRGVVTAPIGFINDHMEVVFDLDVEAAETAAECGLAYRRARTVGVDPRFVESLVHVTLERAAEQRGEAAHPEEGDLGPWPSVCRPQCCTSRPAGASGPPAWVLARRADAGEGRALTGHPTATARGPESSGTEGRGPDPAAPGAHPPSPHPDATTSPRPATPNTGVSPRPPARPTVCGKD
ncbi:MAG: ferrochelatase [Bowdeniella nasicola]|nr:ferrochelatase [Bowdeniella nasicola]